MCDAKVVAIRTAPECSLLHQVYIEWQGKWAGHGKDGGKQWIDVSDIGECVVPWSGSLHSTHAQVVLHLCMRPVTLI